MRIYLVRHGKAEQQSSSGRDEDRALAERGRRQAAYLAKWLAGVPANDRPARIISSPAVRARDTARILAEGLSLTAEVSAELSLTTTLESAVECVLRAAREGTPAVLVGHNPTLEVLVELLTHEHDGTMRTGEAAILDVSAQSEPGEFKLAGRVRLEE